MVDENSRQMASTATESTIGGAEATTTTTTLEISCFRPWPCAAAAAAAAAAVAGVTSRRATTKPRWCRPENVSR